MTEKLDKTVALVTGASSGIGRATAIRLASAGAKVVLVARRIERLKELEQQIKNAGGEAFPIEADLTNVNEANEAITKTITMFGRLDTLVNAAGVMNNGATLERSLEELEQMIAVNLRGLLYITRAALPYLIEAVATSPRKVVDVVNISSVAGRIATAQVAVYNATKFGVTAATEAWRQEFTRQSVRFSVVEPGAVDTELWDEAGWKVFNDLFGKVESLHASDIAEAVAFIVTNPRRVAINEIVVRPTDQK
ncbi:SDR family oxidoreductase [Proteiniphilum acetatigenes]|uniref:SDR family oxidoreductase n=1 Tax=Proteiniphilum acetatigenes TaxID=294710 RepID=UPI000375A631|nr:SDR family NAD(P)-dependent oxidoreductase [Proteiniphilum acetatigenes]